MDGDPRIYDEITTLTAGMNASLSPSLLPREKFALGINTIVRRGFIQCRPGWRRLVIHDSVTHAYKNGQFQSAIYYKPNNGRAQLALNVSGYLYTLTPDGFNAYTAQIQEITLDGPNDVSAEETYMVQAEDFLVVQDGSSKPIIYNGSAARRAGPTEVPVGTRMAYGLGRLWVADDHDVVASDIVGGPSGTLPYNARDAVVKFTETVYFAGGGSFSVPMNESEITAMSFPANLDTSLGEGQLVIFTKEKARALNVPGDRTAWTDEATMRVVAHSGAEGQDGVVTVNSDLFMRSPDGYRTMIYARRDFGSSWGNTPITAELDPVLQYDDERLLRFGTATLFDNRFLGSIAPVRSVGHGIYHRGLIALDFDLISGISGKLPPAYDGVWTGLNILKLITGDFDGEQRCFAFVLNDDLEIELWEFSQARADFGDEQGDFCDRISPVEFTRIEWRADLRSFGFDDGAKFLKQLENGGGVWRDKIRGQVDWTIQFRPDQYPNWVDWDSWSDCANYLMPISTPPPTERRPQYRGPKKLVDPPADIDASDSKPLRQAYEFQVRLKVKGAARLRRLRIDATKHTEEVTGNENVDETCSDMLNTEPEMFGYSSYQAD